MPMLRDAEATRQRLLAAARTEFATYGIAGARVDRIAASARSNKAQIYHYFGSKNGLFDAVWASFVTQVVTDTPIDVDDLAGYAANLAGIYADYPEFMRLVAWQRLERAAEPPPAMSVQHIESNIAAIAQGQADGSVTDQFDARTVFALVLHLATFWGDMNPDVQVVVPRPDGHGQRSTVAHAAARLLTQSPQR